MIDPAANASLLLLLGAVVLLSLPLRHALRRIGLPGLIGMIGLGAVMSAADPALGWLDEALSDQIETLAEIGIIALLFRVGLESDPDRLAGQLGRAATIWLPNMALPGLAAFALVLAWPGLGPVPALLTGIAASATSIGISIAPWEEAGALDTDDGALLLDVAELDDLSAVVLLGVVFAVAPALQEGWSAQTWTEAAHTGGVQFLLIVVFSALCYAFSRLIERPLSALFEGFDARIGPFVFATGAVFLIAAAAQRLGFSVAIGALFAGLAFSRDPAERRIDEAFGYFVAVFGPFFFLSIGTSVATERLAQALPLAVALFAVLTLGKVIGAGAPAWALAGPRTAARIGFSMVPRAEIFLIVMLHGLSLGAWAVPQQLYAAAVIAAIGTCVVGPLATARLLARSETRKEAA